MLSLFLANRRCSELSMTSGFQWNISIRPASGGKRKKNFCWFDLGNNFCVPQHCVPAESFLSSHPFQSAAENLKTYRRWRWDFAQSLPFDTCLLPHYIYLSYMLLANKMPLLGGKSWSLSTALSWCSSTHLHSTMAHHLQYNCRQWLQAAIWIN